MNQELIPISMQCIALQNSLDCDFLASEPGEFRFVSFQGIDLFLCGQCVLHCILRARLRAQGRSLVLGHVRSAAHRINGDSCNRLLLRNYSLGARKRQREYCSQCCFGL